MNYYFFLITITGILTGCSQQKDTGVLKNDQTINLSADFKDQLIYSDFFEEISFIYLNTPKEVFIGSIDKIMIRKNKIAILDLAKETVWLFSNTGEYLRQLQVINGRGPDEITQLSDAFFTSDSSIAVVGAFRILEYNLTENSIINSLDKPFFAPRFEMIENSLMVGFTANGLLDQTSENNLRIFTEEGKEIGGLIPIDNRKKRLALIGPHSFYWLNDTLHHFSFIDYNIYSITSSEQINSKYKLNLNEFQIPDNLFEKINSYERPTDFARTEIYENGYPVITTVLESNRYLFVNLMFARERKRGHILYDKKLNSTKSSIGIMNNFYPDMDFYFRTSDENYFYGFEEYNEVVTYLEENYEDHPQLNYLRQFSNSDGDITNPVLVHGKVKE